MTSGLRGRKAIAALEERVRTNPNGYRYIITVDGKPWAYGRHVETMQAAAASAQKGWAKGRRVEVVKLKE